MDRYYNHILSFPSTLREQGISFERFGRARRKFDGIVIVGMGGSGLPGEILKGVREEVGVHIPVVLVKDYDIPKLSFRDPLYVCVSFSGGTEEVIRALLSLPKAAKKAVVTGGGKLYELALQKKIPCAKFDQGGYAPRQATGLMFYALAGVLARMVSGARKAKEYAKAVDGRYFEKDGARLAKSMKNKIILVYSGPVHGFLAYNWKIRFNENAKAPSFCGVLPEIDHNEIAGFGSNGWGRSFFALFLDDPHSRNLKIRKRTALTRAVLKKYGVRSDVISLQGKTLLEKTWNSILLAEWASYFLAKQMRIDPFDTTLIEMFKRMMKK